MAIPDHLARKLEALPDKPGVYLWKNAAGEILYVGKAKSLRARVPSYFGPDAGGTPEQAALVAQTATPLPAPPVPLPAPDAQDSSHEAEA